LQFAFALVLAAAFFYIGYIPSAGGSQSDYFNSFGSLALFYMLVPPLELLGRFNPPIVLCYVLAVLIGLSYMLLLTLPAYFSFRRRKSWLISVQIVAIAIHALFGVYVVTPWWKSFN